MSLVNDPVSAGLALLLLVLACVLTILDSPNHGKE